MWDFIRLGTAVSYAQWGHFFGADDTLCFKEIFLFTVVLALSLLSFEVVTFSLLVISLLTFSAA